MGYGDLFPTAGSAGEERVWPIPDWIFSPDRHAYSPDPTENDWLEIPVEELPEPDPRPFEGPHPYDVLVKLDAGWILSQAEMAVKGRKAFDRGEAVRAGYRFVPLDHAEQKRQYLQMAYEIALTPGSRSALSPAGRLRSDEDQDSDDFGKSDQFEAAKARLLGRAKRALTVLVRGSDAGAKLRDRLERDPQFKDNLYSAALLAAHPLYETDSPTLPTADWWRQYKTGVIREIKFGILGEGYDARQKRMKRANVERVAPPDDWDAAVAPQDLEWALCSNPDLAERIDRRMREADLENQLNALSQQLKGKDQKILHAALSVFEEEGRLNLSEVSRRTNFPNSTVRYRWSNAIIPRAWTLRSG